MININEIIEYFLHNFEPDLSITEALADLALEDTRLNRKLLCLGLDQAMEQEATAQMH